MTWPTRTVVYLLVAVHAHIARIAAAHVRGNQIAARAIHARIRRTWRASYLTSLSGHARRTHAAKKRNDRLRNTCSVIEARINVARNISVAVYARVRI